MASFAPQQPPRPSSPASRKQRGAQGNGSLRAKALKSSKLSDSGSAKSEARAKSKSKSKTKSKTTTAGLPAGEVLQSKSRPTVRLPLREREEGERRLSPEIREQLAIARMWMEKCEFAEARRIYAGLLEIATYREDPVTAMEALAGLIRLAGEASDAQQAERWEHELERWMERHPQFTPARVWYCKGALARSQRQPMKAQRFFLRYLRELRKPDVRSDDRREAQEEIIRAWLLLATALQQRDRMGRAARLGQIVLRELEKNPIRSLNGNAFVLLGYIEEQMGRLTEAMAYYRRAHSVFLAEHNWFYHLSVLYAYARISRRRGQHAQAEFYLDLVAGACTSPELATLRTAIEGERAKLDLDSVDLVVHPRRGEAVFRGRSIEFARQFVLMDLLEALAEAHGREGGDEDRGLSKRDLVEKVWGEKYRPEIHDNKLYYNINRLRRLIESDVKDPQILLSWREGYRLALSLKIRIVREAGADAALRRESEEKLGATSSA